MTGRILSNDHNGDWNCQNSALKDWVSRTEMTHQSIHQTLGTGQYTMPGSWHLNMAEIPPARLLVAKKNVSMRYRHSSP